MARQSVKPKLRVTSPPVTIKDTVSKFKMSRSAVSKIDSFVGRFSAPSGKSVSKPTQKYSRSGVARSSGKKR